MQVFGDGSVSGQCTGQSQKIAVPVFAFSFPGWSGPGDRLRLRALVHVRLDVALDPNHALRPHPLGNPAQPAPPSVTCCGMGER